MRYKTFVSTLHCALENGADLYVNEHQKIQHYRARSAEERRKKKFSTDCSRNQEMNMLQQGYAPSGNKGTSVRESHKAAAG